MHSLYLTESCFENYTLTVLELYEVVQVDIYAFLNQLKSVPPGALVFVCLFWLLEWIPSGNRTLTSEFLFFYCFYFPDFYFHFYFWFLAMFGSDSGLHTASVLFPVNRRMGTYSLLGMTGQIIWYNSLLVCRRISLAFTGKKKSPLRSRSVSTCILCFL